jgi:hypothetical protein
VRARSLLVAALVVAGCSAPERTPRDEATPRVEGAPPEAAPRDEGAPPEAAPPPRAPEPIAAARMKAPHVAFPDVQGRLVQLDDLYRDGPLVIVLTSLRCPISRLYAPGLAELAARHAAAGVRVLIVEIAGASRDDLLAAAQRHAWVDPIVVAQDAPPSSVGQCFFPERTTECFVVDRQGDLRYRGAIDDQYGQGYRRPAPKSRYLEDALAAVLAGQPVAVPATSAPGCALARAPTPQDE